MIEEPQPQYLRVNVLIATAVSMVIVCVAVTVWMTVKDEFAKGILTLVLGRFLGYVDNIYNFEFGTTRSSAKKDDTIKELTKTAGVTADAALAANVRPVVTPAAPSPGQKAEGIIPAAEVAAPPEPKP